MMAIDYSKTVAIPPPESMNGGLHFPTAAFMLDLLGKPRTQLADDCLPPTNALLKKLIITYDVGPFNATGIKPAVLSLERIFAEVKKSKPDLYEQIGTAGMLCCRRIRGSVSTPSNHSWGCSIDLKINGKLDQRADGKCQRGLLELYPFFHNEMWFWGAEYKGVFEDSMHFDCSQELLLKWRREGKI